MEPAQEKKKLTIQEAVTRAMRRANKGIVTLYCFKFEISNLVNV